MAGALKTKWRTFPTEISLNGISQWRSGSHTCVHHTEWGLGVRLRLWGLNLRERTRVDCFEDNLRGLV